MRNKIVFLLFLTTLAIFAVSGISCRQSKTTKKELKIWLVDYKETVFKSSINLFAQKEKVDIKIEEKTSADLEKDLLNALATHQGPDVVMTDHDFLIEHKDVFIPCVREIKNNKALYCDPEILKNNYAPITQILVWDNKVYGYPYRVSTPIVLYNSQILNDAREKLRDNNFSQNKIPVYWDDFVKMARLLTQKDAAGNITISGLALGTVSNNPIAQDILYSLMLQNGTEISNQEALNPLALFNLPIRNENNDLIYPGAKALDFYTSFSYKRSENYSFNENFDTVWKDFAKGKIAMIIDYPERLDKIRYSNSNLKVSGALFPQITNTESPTVYGKVYVFGVTHDTKDAVLAWKLAGQLAKKFEKNYIKKDLGSAKDWREAKNASQVWATQVNFAQTIYKAQYPTEFDKFVREAIDNAAKNILTPKESLDRAASSINQLATETE